VGVRGATAWAEQTACRTRRASGDQGKGQKQMNDGWLFIPEKKPDLPEKENVSIKVKVDKVRVKIRKTKAQKSKQKGKHDA
jgi:hypothetical protein